MKRAWIGSTLLGVFLLGAGNANAQVTTGAVGGRVTSTTGQAITQATITVVNGATGFSVSANSRVNGAYLVPGLEPGGPYTVTVRAIGYRSLARSNVSVPLAGTVTVDFSLEAAPVQLEEIVVAADPLAADFSANRQGTQTIVADTAIRRLPSLDRELTDFTKLTPQVAVRDGGEGGVVALGQNNRFNTVQLDGATVNDRFGLGRTGYAGGQAEGRPVALEAVKEIQVLVAPYDVRQGNFSGALLNAITKSGTNEYKATGFFQYRDNGIAGDPLGLSEFTNKQFGGSFGGPIVQDKAHFFIAAELRRAARPASGPYLGSSSPAPVFLSSDLTALAAAAQSRYGISSGELGSLAQINNDRPVTNLTGRIDYNMGSSRLVFRYNYNAAQSDVFSRSTSGTIDLSSQGYFFDSKNHNPALQFYSNFTNGSSNELLVSYNRIRDKRTPNAALPAITVQNFTEADGSGAYSLRFGAEQFSQGNELDQDIFELTDNFSFTKGDHRITIGTRNELYKVRNAFLQSSYGVWQFDNLSDFQNGIAEAYTVSAPLKANSLPVRFKTGQLGVYVQDSWSPTPYVTLNLGLRADVPFWLDQPEFAPQVITDFGPQTIPDWQVLVSPRVGFNWDATKNGVNQVRGGIGIFTGTPAYVWLSNFFQQSGQGLGILSCGQGSANPVPAVPSSFDITNPVIACGNGVTIAPGSSLGEINLIEKGTKFPQVLRSNLAWDRRLDNTTVLSIEGTFTKGINDIVTVQRNLGDPVGTGQGGRVLYGTLNANGTVTPNYFNLARYGPSFSAGVLELRNASSSLAWSMTGQLRRRFSNGLEGSVAYTYSAAYDAQSFTSSRGTSNWRFGRMNAGRDDVFERTRSSFDRPHRIVANVSYSLPWRNYPTDISVTYVGQSGQPYTLAATGSSGRGDLNRDGHNGNDPIYIPMDATNPNEIQFIDNGSITAATQAQAFEAYIAGESCLDKQRGQIMERNSCRNPWQNFLDLNVRQSVPTFNGRKLTIEMGIYNVLNLLNSDWGLVKTADGGVFYQMNSLFMPSSGSVVNGREAFQLANNIPVPGGSRSDLATQRFIDTGAASNSYQIQFGVRWEY